MKAWKIIGLIGGIAAMASSFAHALGGWPAMAEGLASGSPPPEIVAALRIGWHWGSFTMFCLGTIVVREAVASLRGGHESRFTVGAIAATYILFGLWAMLSRDLNPSFLLFVVTGLLMACLLLPGRHRSRASS